MSTTQHPERVQPGPHALFVGRYVDCPRCDGRGSHVERTGRGGKRQYCTRCGGRGTVRLFQSIESFAAERAGAGSR